MKNPGIYILTSPSGKQYVGKDSNLPNRIKQHFRGKNPCPLMHRALQKYGADAFGVETIQYPGISQEALNAVERWYIQKLNCKSPYGYNLTDGGDGSWGFKHSQDTRQQMSKSAQKLVKDGTHHMLGENNPSRRRVEDGTHNLLGENNPVHKQIADGTHHFLDGEIARRTQKKRVEDGTHNLLGGEIQRSANKKQIEDGTHNFLGDKHPSKKRIKDGTHHFLDSEFQRSVNKKRIEDGTHNFLGNNNWKRKKRQKAEWCYIIALSRFWYEIHDYTLKRRKLNSCLKTFPTCRTPNRSICFR